MSKSSSILSPDAKGVVASLRALLVSQKYPYRLHDLLREYEQLEGAGMNWTKYGFKTFEDFLSASGEFLLQKHQGQTLITARPKKDTAHIVKMVQKQKNPKVKKQQLRQPYFSDQSWNKSSFSANVYPKLITESHKKNRNIKFTMKSNGAGDNNNNHVRPNGQKLCTTTVNIVNKQTTPLNNKPFDLRERLIARRDLNQTLNQKQTIDLRDHLNSKRDMKQSHFASRAILKQDDKKPMPSTTSLQARIQKSQSGGGNINAIEKPQLILGPNQQNKNNNQHPQQIKSPTLSTPAANNPTNGQKQNVNNRLRGGVSVELTKLSIQDRLKINQSAVIGLRNNSSDSDVSNNSVIATIRQSDNKETKKKIAATDKKPVTENGKNPAVYHFNPNMDPITSLVQFCQVRRYSPPNYEFLKTKFSPKIQARVLVNGKMYSTYPDDFDTEFEARVSCATIALNQIKAEDARNRFPVCTDSDVELAMKLFQELRNHPHGIFVKNIPEFFQSTFQQTLPDHWLSVLQSSKQFITETTAGNNMIVLANVDSDTSSTSSISDSEFITLDRINFPWAEKYWNLYITHCISTTEIWARIVGREYSDQLDSVMTDVDLSMLTSKTRPTSIICGQIYLVSMSECWHRVRVENMNKSDGKCFCFFIDFGDEEWIAVDQLFVCEPRFLRLPPQAIPLSLYGLEDFAENPNAKIHLDGMLIGKTLIAEILTKREAFEVMNDSDVDFNTRIQVVLYDTSSNEDVNLNPLLLTKICDDTPPPELRRTGATNVTVTHVNNNGEVFVQVKSVGLVYIQKLINQLVESKFKEEEHQVVLSDLKKPDAMFFIQDMDDMKWYRGALVPDENKFETNQYNIFYVVFV